ncbi:MAG TPA: alpha/beta hydrolase family protein [Syntrophales bacterium]|nr:alpha/beta hydrolase family protein [Syntrophales bacterium]HOL60062.1 alpha/beta hydrolase family protein [Syntrophales bacterium]HPO36172.1 alpha/beta hydrolase family protein [Syntrophales bacterium]
MVSFLDLIYARLANRKRFFHQGWGDLPLLEHLADTYRPGVDGDLEIEVNWEGEQEEGEFIIKRGWFDSPARDVKLPEGSEKAYLEWVLPASFDSRTPVTLHFAATGDEGFLRRRVAFALPLARQGVSSIILENPYYGLRRPVNQAGKFLSYVSDLWKMGRAAAVEGLAIFHWLRKQGYHLQVACGVSMGGHIAAKVANFSREPIGCVAFIAPHSAEAVYLQGILRHYVAWEVLKRESQGRFDPEEFFRKVLSRTDIREMSPPHPIRAAVIIGALNDAYIPRQSVEILHNHWPEARIKWVRGGHVSAFLRHRKELLKGVQEVFEVLTK